MNKREILCSMLAAGWQRMPTLVDALGWQKHTVRGAISTLGKTQKIERRRDDGVTSYRIAPLAPISEPDSASEIPVFLKRGEAAP